MKRSELKQIIKEEIAKLTVEAAGTATVPTEVQQFADERGPVAQRLVKQVEDWVQQAGKRIVGGTAIGKYSDGIVLHLTRRGHEIYIDTSGTGSISVNSVTVHNYKEFRRQLRSIRNFYFS